MRINQITLIFCIICSGGSFARSFQPTSFDYDYQIEGRNAPTRHRGRGASTTPRPLIQQYWQNFVKNLPTLPPLRWNMNNSLGNLFTVGAQQIIETPIAMHHLMEEPNRKRRINRKRKATKKNKNGKIIRSSHRNYYGNSYYNQLQLQPLGVDKNRVMHLYEPTSGEFYALHVESQPYFFDDEDNDDDSYFQHKVYEDQNSGYTDEDEGYGEDDSSYEEQYEPQSHEYDDSDINEYDKDESDSHGDSNSEYDDDVEVVDNWGYNDEEIFADRKLKGEANSLKALAGSLIKIRKDHLKPETVDDVVKQLNNDKKANDEQYKQKLKKEDADKKDNELGRDAWGSLTKAGVNTKRKQNVKTKAVFKLVKVPRAKAKFYVLPGNIIS